MVLRLGFGRLERAGEDGDARVAHLLRHLRVREILVDEHAAHEHRVLHAAAGLR